MHIVPRISAGPSLKSYLFLLCTQFSRQLLYKNTTNKTQTSKKGAALAGTNTDLATGNSPTVREDIQKLECRLQTQTHPWKAGSCSTVSQSVRLVPTDGPQLSGKYLFKLMNE